jgi:hypothetical protein
MPRDLSAPLDIALLINFYRPVNSRAHKNVALLRSAELGIARNILYVLSIVLFQTDVSILRMEAAFLLNILTTQNSTWSLKPYYKNRHRHQAIAMVEWLTILLRIQDVLGSNLNLETDYSTEILLGFFQSLEANAEIIP